MQAASRNGSKPCPTLTIHPDMAHIPRWLAISVAMTVLTIVAHEIAHYTAALAMGAQDVTLHWADITYAPASLDRMGEIIIWSAGPILTHALILWAIVSQSSRPAMLALGLGAASDRRPAPARPIRAKAQKSGPR